MAQNAAGAPKVHCALDARGKYLSWRWVASHTKKLCLNLNMVCVRVCVCVSVHQSVCKLPAKVEIDLQTKGVTRILVTPFVLGPFNLSWCVINVLAPIHL